MTLQEHIDRMKRLAQEIIQDQRPIFLASSSTVAAMSDRIFTKGQTVNGGQFQYNDTKPLYVNPAKTFGNTSGLKPPRGKTGKTKFASTGQPHKTTFVSSYKELRELVRREDSFVNWEANGDLKFEIETQRPPPQGQDNTGSNTITPKKINDTEYIVAVSSDENTGKLQGLIKKYPGVFQLSKDEKTLYITTFNKEFLRIVKEKLR